VMVWMHRTNKNAHAIAPGEVRFSPGLCVVFWLIPGVNLLFPYLAMLELWHSSDPDPAGQNPPGEEKKSSVGSWWVVWVLFVCLRLSVVVPAVVRVLGVHGILILSHILCGLAASLMMQVVRDIDQRQLQRAIGMTRLAAPAASTDP